MSKRVATVAALLALPAAAVLSFSAFWRRNSAPTSDPSGSLTDEDFRDLLQVVGTYFALRNCRVSFQGGELVVEGPAGRAHYPLQELVGICRGRRREQWPALVGLHFAEGASERPAVPVDPALARPAVPAVPPRPAEPAAAPREPVDPDWPALETPRQASAPEPEPPAREAPPASEAPTSFEPEPPRPFTPLRPIRPVVPPAAPGEPGRAEEGRQPPESAVGGRVGRGAIDEVLRSGPPRWPAAPEPPAEAAPEEPVAPAQRAVPPAEAAPEEPVAPAQRAVPPAVSVPPVPPARPPVAEPPVEPVAAQPAEPPVEPAAAEPAGDWAAFSALVEACFRRHGLQATVEVGGVRARDGAGRESHFPAPGLDSVPRALSQEQWARFVDSTFGEPLRRLRRGGSLAGRSFAEVRGLLAIQLFSVRELKGEEREATIYADGIPGLLSAIVCRLPQGAVRLAPGVVKEWGVPAEEAFVAALANLRELRPPVQRATLAPGVEGLYMEDGEGFAAAQALTLEDSRECSGVYGAVVALPRRGLLVACPLRPMRGANAAYGGVLMDLIERTLAAERNGGTPLARSLYWYHGGAFTELPYEVQTRGGEPAVDLYPPDAFVAALEALEGGG